MAVANSQEPNILTVPYTSSRCRTPPLVKPVAPVEKDFCDSSTSTPGARTKCGSSPFDSVIKVVVGPPRRNPTTFYVHDTLLVASSPFFRACLTHSCEESVSGVIKLPTDRADTFSFFLQWLYHQHSCSLVNVPASQSSHLLDGSSMLPDTPASPSITDTPVPRIAPKFFPYLRLYIFAFRYFLPFALKNAIVDRITQLADTYNSVPNIDDVKLLWDELPTGAKLRDLVLDLFTWKRTERLLKEGEEDGWGQEFLWELCRRLKLKKIAAGPPWKGERGCCGAGYHEHEEGELCGGHGTAH